MHRNKFHRGYRSVLAGFAFLSLFLPSLAFSEVVIYTGATSWISQEEATRQAEICKARLEPLGIPVTVYIHSSERDLVAEWVELNTADGDFDALILFGHLPNTIYPGNNRQPEASLVERFIETTDGDAIINHADYMFSDSIPENGPMGLVHISDMEKISLGFQNTWMEVTPLGEQISPSLFPFYSDRSFPISQLPEVWKVEAALAQTPDGKYADPVIIRDGDLGRLIPIFQSENITAPMGAVAAEIIAWISEVELVPTKLSLKGSSQQVIHSPIEFVLSAVDASDTITPGHEVTVKLNVDPPTGSFDLAPFGSFDGSLTTVTLPEDGTLKIYYKDQVPGIRDISVEVLGESSLSPHQHRIALLNDNSGSQGEVAIYTGNTGWIYKQRADQEADRCRDKLALAGVDTTLFQNDGDFQRISDWVQQATGNGQVDVLVLYGYLPETLYKPKNLEGDGSILEAYLESLDGDVVINHGDYMFYVSTSLNDVQGLQNIADSPTLTMWGENTPMLVTPLGHRIAPSLENFQSDRPLNLEQLADQWFVEVALALDHSGQRADPVILRDRNRGRMVPMFQTRFQEDPKGSVAAETIFWIYEIEIGNTRELKISSEKTAGLQGEWIPFSLELEDWVGSPNAALEDVTVSISSSSTRGSFDSSPDGEFDGTIKELIIPAGTSKVVGYYKNPRIGTFQITALVDGFESVTQEVSFFEKAYHPPGEVAIWMGDTMWLDQEKAAIQAKKCRDRLDLAGVFTNMYSIPPHLALLEQWVNESTDNGQLDVLILFGSLPSVLYPAGNTLEDDSLIELFLESPDGDTVINHGDWMFFNSDGDHPTQGLPFITDSPEISMAGFDNLKVTVTETGRAISPSLTDFHTDRPLHLNSLGGDWVVEDVLAQNRDGSLADPVIIRDGDRGRLVPLFQTDFQDDQKGVVASDIIAYLFGGLEFPADKIELTGTPAAVVGIPVSLNLTILDATGVPIVSTEDLTLKVSSDSPTGRFADHWLGEYLEEEITVVLPAGESEVRVFFKDSDRGDVKFRATHEGDFFIPEGEMDFSVYPKAEFEEFDFDITFAIYTGRVSWIEKEEAEEQAIEIVRRTSQIGFPIYWFSRPEDEPMVRSWAIEATDNGTIDVLMLFGTIPDTIYKSGNAEPDGSVLEVYLESADGNFVLDHSYYPYSDSTRDNDVGALQYLMDNPDVFAWGNYFPEVSDQGSGSIKNYSLLSSDREFNREDLSGEWFVESEDPEPNDENSEFIILRDGDRGRIVAVRINGRSYSISYEKFFRGLPGIRDTWGIFRRGDVNGNGVLDISDPILNLDFQFLGNYIPDCLDACDFDDNGKVEITDPIANLAHQFAGTAPPFPPGPDRCGFDPTTDDPFERELDCKPQPTCLYWTEDGRFGR